MSNSDVETSEVETEATSNPEVGTKPEATPKPGEQKESATGKPEAGKQEAQKAEPEKPKVPETYEFKGQDGKALTGPAIEHFAAMAKQNGWTQETATQQFAAMSKSLRATTEAQAAVWKAEVAKLPEFQGKAGEESKAAIALAMRAFGSEPLKQLLDATALGDAPPMVLLFRAIGKAISPDRFTQGVAVLGRPGHLSDPGDTSAKAFAKAYDKK